MRTSTAADQHRSLQSEMVSLRMVVNLEIDQDGIVHAAAAAAAGFTPILHQHDRQQHHHTWPGTAGEYTSLSKDIAKLATHHHHHRRHHHHQHQG